MEDCTQDLWDLTWMSTYCKNYIAKLIIGNLAVLTKLSQTRVRG